MDDDFEPAFQSSGHSRALRSRLRAARERLGLSGDAVARRIQTIIGDDEPVHRGTISNWETFKRHPRIDVFAAWARAVGLRLIVDLDAADGKRIPVLLDPETAEVARELDLLTPEDRKIIAATVRRMLPVGRR